MQSIIIIALILLWLAVTLIIGTLMETVSAEIVKIRRKRKAAAMTERNIILYRNRRGEQRRKIVTEP